MSMVSLMESVRLFPQDRQLICLFILMTFMIIYATTELEKKFVAIGRVSTCLVVFPKSESLFDLISDFPVEHKRVCISKKYLSWDSFLL